MQYMTVREVASHYRVSRDTIVRWIKRGRIAADNIGTPQVPRYRIRDCNLGALIVESINSVPEDVIEYIS